MDSASSTILDAAAYIAPSGSLVESASLLGDAACALLAQDQKVVVRLRNLRGVSSSYFNMFFSKVVERFGARVLDEILTFDFGSAAQREIAERSLAAAR